jgi:hypothetical protein
MRSRSDHEACAVEVTSASCLVEVTSAACYVEVTSAACRGVPWHGGKEVILEHVYIVQ